MFFVVLLQIQGTSTNPDRALTAEISDELIAPRAAGGRVGIFLKKYIEPGSRRSIDQRPNCIVR